LGDTAGSVVLGHDENRNNQTFTQNKGYADNIIFHNEISMTQNIAFSFMLKKASRLFYLSEPFF